ncbi:AraC family transcriptional regulator [Cellulomonas carbonis]|uniref:AraC family transcriptional regulator n=1 Tax=Cellulomonas carbonis T26 TaxID=947969 RepID=A0A0A0BUG1_9CELL|nr:helix-turn-helix domain-containing protein [Cellulomonas carbonis]KGM11571.1 AraC family transcriptional regulator [Cellulomonas carbonis T26]GGC06747.1 AraC family transcriptional regulator [Cellulomonas carbonis]
MKADSSAVVDRAHLADPRDGTWTIHRYEVDPGHDGLDDLAARHWVPVWSVPPGGESVQRVLQYPVANLVIASGYARFYGVVTGLSTTTLRGDGWAVGVMLAPAGGYLLGGPMHRYTDRWVGVEDVLGERAGPLVAAVHAAMAPDPSSAASHAAAVGAVDDVLRGHLPVDDEGHLVNRVVAYVEGTPDVTRVAQVCDAFAMSERSLQRLLHRRLGLTPRWLVQRRRLQEAAELIRAGTARTFADVAATLGYADQAHLSRDVVRVTGMTPTALAQRFGISADRRAQGPTDTRAERA